MRGGASIGMNHRTECGEFFWGTSLAALTTAFPRTQLSEISARREARCDQRHRGDT